MALIVEDGSGLSNAESYISVADADTYVAAHYATAAWTSKNSTEKELALRLATQYLDATYLRAWRGARAHDTQALAWPRTEAWDDDGFAIDDESVPQAVQDACVELAVKQAAGDTLIEDVDEPGDLKSEMVKVGEIETSETYVGGKSPIKDYRLVRLLLRKVADLGQTAERG